MKAKEVKVSPQELLDKLEGMGNRSWRDGNLLDYKVGTEADPAENIMRPVGGFESCRVHYVQDFIDSDDIVSRVPVCAGNKCPICQASKFLYQIGTDEATEKAKELSSSERNYWNIIPRDKEAFGQGSPRCMVLSFGAMARKSLVTLAQDYGHPGDIKEGFDIVFEVYENETRWGKNYRFYPVKSTQKEEGRLVQLIEQTPLTEEELEYELVDLSKYTSPPNKKQLERLAEIFQVEASGADLGKERKEEKPACFGDLDEFNPDSNTCKDCSYFKKCKIEILRSE